MDQGWYREEISTNNQTTSRQASSTVETSCSIYYEETVLTSRVAAYLKFIVLLFLQRMFDIHVQNE